MRRLRIARRTLLRGAGVALALPPLEAMTPWSGSAKAAPGARRLLFYFTPCGWAKNEYNGEGPNFGFRNPNSPLIPYRGDIITFSGMQRKSSSPSPGNHGLHEHATRTILTQVFVEGGMPNATSADQIAANALQGKTRFKSLELGWGKDYPIAWAGPDQPLPRETSPANLFRTLTKDAVATDAESMRLAELRKKRNLSVIDFGRTSAQSLTAQLGTGDRQRMDEYLTGLREVEQRISASTATCEAGAAPGAAPDHTAWVRQNIDLMVMAFRCDLTRVITFMRGGCWGGLMSFGYLGISNRDEHSISHDDASGFAEMMVINKWDATQFAYLIDKLKSTQDTTGTLFDNTIALWLSEYGSQPGHQLNDLSFTLTGRGNGAVKLGRRMALPSNTPFSNLLMTMMDYVGAKPAKFGDATGTINLG